MNKILLIEDDPEIYNIVNSAIGGQVELKWAERIAAARKALSEEHFDLILLDVELPDGNGMDFCLQIQSIADAQNTAIFFLTAHGDLSQKVMGFSAGADDYVVKPFSPLELKARIEARLKKNSMLRNSQSLLSWKELKINRNNHEVSVFNGTAFENVNLTSIEYKILSFFAQHPDTVVSRDDILNTVWGKEVYVDARSVDTHVSKLRKKLDKVSHIIKSVHGAGYKFVPNKA